MAETEDIPYAVSEFATPDEEVQPDDPDQVNKGVLLEIQTYLDEAIDEHNSIDVLDLQEQAKIPLSQQVALHKLVAQHLRNIKSTIDNKIKELK